MKASQLLIECAHRRIFLHTVLLDDPMEICRPPGERTKAELEWTVANILKMHRTDRRNGHGGLQVKVDPFDTITLGWVPVVDLGNPLSLIDDLQDEGGGR